MHVEEAGRTFEKKSLPILVIADPPVENPDDVGDRLVAFAWAGHQLVTVDVTKRTERQTLVAGIPIVKTSQPLGTLAAYLLEPQSEDGFCTWNFLDDELEKHKDLPILRIPTVIVDD